MKKTFCDKCGKTMQEGTYISLRPNLPDYLRDIYPESPEPTDLCSECYTKFNDWLNKSIDSDSFPENPSSTT